MNLLPEITEAEKSSLLKLARESLAYYLAQQRLFSLEEFTDPITKVMSTNYGCFVTLKKYGDLRGCIGTIIPSHSLAQHVLENVIKSAIEDPRFPPVTTEESAELSIEITILSPPHPVDSYEQIEIGKHGMILEKNGYRALFLPQVATEQGWDLATTLSHLARKAGLDQNAWQSDCKFQIFEGLEFNDKE